jgi:general L-amino acid transport system permease protein
MTMQASHFVSPGAVAARPAPGSQVSAVAWLRKNLFASALSSAMTVAVIAVLAWVLWWFAKWALVDAVWGSGDGQADAARCRAIDGLGACWPVVHAKARLILFGLYPYDQQWRPAIACLLMILLYLVSAWRRSWRPLLAAGWAVVLAAVGVLMWGGVAGLSYVSDEQWGGLPVTLFLSTFGLAFAFPFAILLALARQSTRLKGLRALAVAYVELVRGIPLITVLFMASVMFPLFLPDGVSFSKLLRVQIAIAMFAAAYLAEVIRGGLSALPKGQHEAAAAIGLGYWRRTFLVILPQALRMVIPGIVNTFISFFKATSIVVVVGIFDLMTAAKRSVADPQWQGFGTELYLFVGLIYFVFCFSMSRYSKALEHRLARHAER